VQLGEGRGGGFYQRCDHTLKVASSRLRWGWNEKRKGVFRGRFGSPYSFPAHSEENSVFQKGIEKKKGRPKRNGIELRASDDGLLQGRGPGLAPETLVEKGRKEL